MNFREYLNEDKNFLSNGIKKDDIKSALLKKFSKVSIPAIGSSLDVMIEFPTKSEAENANIKEIVKIISKIVKVKHYKSPDYGNGFVQDADKGTSDSDPHELYISFKMV